MPTLIVNGKRHTIDRDVSEIRVEGSSVIVDGKTIQDGLSGVVKVVWEGPVANLHVTGNLDCGNVSGSVRANGNVQSDDIGGDVKADGNVLCRRINGNVKAGGNIVSR